MAALAVFDRNSGIRLSCFKMSGLRFTCASHFANDIAVGNLGNAYVTDSFAPLVHKVDAHGAASVFLEDAALAALAGKFGLNGIVYHPDGYLLMAKSAEGALLKVLINNPKGFSKVTASGLDLNGDSLLLADNTTLLVVCNAQGQVYRLRSTDGFGGVSRPAGFATGPVYPTTLLTVGSNDYLRAVFAPRCPAAHASAVRWPIFPGAGAVLAAL